jgi:GT2 family glycosyltransferase
MLEGDRVEAPRTIPFEDELRWAYFRADRFWTAWAAWRSLAVGRAGPFRAFSALRVVLASGRPADPPPFVRAGTGPDRVDSPGRPGVSVLLPTLDRYPYLLMLLDQLRRQTLRPAEVIVLDQTARDRRRYDLAERFPDLPLKVFPLDIPGQCSSRNLGLRSSSQEYILFLDDDVEVAPDFIESHVRCLERHEADSSSGAIQDVEGTPQPPGFTLFRASDVFPAGNSLLRREALLDSGLFDLAYDRGARADGDLGMRLYLSGARMVYDPSIVVLHHHAPSGGLRSHKARKVTYASSTSSLVQRHLPSPTEIYLSLRHFTQLQAREALLLRIFQTFRIRGGPVRCALKLAVATAQLPSTLWLVWKNYRRAVAMTREFPRIESLPPPVEVGHAPTVTHTTASTPHEANS